MTKILTIELPEELENRLEAQAMHQKMKIEDLVVEWIAKQVNPVSILEPDPIMPLVGTIFFDADDLADHHDEYLGATLYEEVNRAG